MNKNKNKVIDNILEKQRRRKTKNASCSELGDKNASCSELGGLQLPGVQSPYMSWSYGPRGRTRRLRLTCFLPPPGKTVHFAPLAMGCSNPTFNQTIMVSIARNISKKKKVAPGRTPYSLSVWRSRRIERKLAFWVCGLILGAAGQGSMPPGRTRRNQELRRYPMQKGSPDAKRFAGRNPIG